MSGRRYKILYPRCVRDECDEEKEFACESEKAKLSRPERGVSEATEPPSMTCMTYDLSDRLALQPSDTVTS